MCPVRLRARWLVAEEAVCALCTGVMQARPGARHAPLSSQAGNQYWVLQFKGTSRPLYALCRAATDLTFVLKGYVWQMVNCAFTAAYSLTLRGVMDKVERGLGWAVLTQLMWRLWWHVILGLVLGNGLPLRLHRGPEGPCCVCSVCAGDHCDGKRPEAGRVLHGRAACSACCATRIRCARLCSAGARSPAHAQNLANLPSLPFVLNPVANSSLPPSLPCPHIINRCFTTTC